MRPTFHDSERQRHLWGGGYVSIPSRELRSPLLPDGLWAGSELESTLWSLFRSLDVPDDAGFYASCNDASRQNARRIDLSLKHLIGPLLSPLLDDHVPFLAAFVSKAAGIGGRMACHQDLTYVDERSFRTVMAWIPLVDVDTRAGALEVVPGSHRWSKAIRPSGGAPLPTDDLQAELSRRSVPLAVGAGDVVVFDTALVHGSTVNTRSAVRPAVAVAFAPREAQLLVGYQGVAGDRLEMFQIDDTFFTTQPFRSRPQGYDQVEPWDRPLSPADLMEHLVEEPPPGGVGAGGAVTLRSVAPPHAESATRRDAEAGRPAVGNEAIRVDSTMQVTAAEGLRHPLRWETFAAADAAQHAGCLDELLDRTRDGVTITGVFTPEEVDGALDRLDAAPQLAHTFGALIGMSLGMVGEEPDRSRYLDDTERARSIYRDAFGFDPHDRLAETLRPIASGRTLEPPFEDGRSYNPGQIRIWAPDSAGLPAHVGNEFRRLMEHGAMRHLLTVTEVANHLSYFVVLRKARVGGALAVYDLLWEEDQGAGDVWENGARVDTRFDGIPCTRFNPDPGDLVLFGGGWRWHRVDPLDGGSRRVTYGGFAAPSVDGRALHFWA